ncbi:AraC family transcriptional regulator [Salinisphaera sp. SPP-AMP-43]|uniref:helix-turn-helix domain-containing protein n=1 Tax=Salinisphaera sp. SPP-AMP-43 TaxID=3121288 RepID=UPI003C6E474C
MNQTDARLNPVQLGQGQHRHGFTQLLFGLSGAVVCDMATGAFEVSAHQIGIVPRNASHYFAGRTENSRLLVVDLFLDDDVVRQIQTLDARQSFDDVFMAPRLFGLPSELRPMVDCAVPQLGHAARTNRLLSHQWATMLAVQVYRLLTAAPERRPREERFQHLIDCRLDTPPSNAELQQHLEMSGSALNQWCRRRYGLSPQQVVMRRRLYWGMDRLINSNHSIGQIAHDMGFADAPSFTRAFGRVYGTSPGAARRAGTEHADGSLMNPRRANARSTVALGPGGGSCESTSSAVIRHDPA